MKLHLQHIKRRSVSPTTTNYQDDIARYPRIIAPQTTIIREDHYSAADRNKTTTITNLNLLTTYDRDDNVDRLITNYLTIDRRGIDVTFRSYPNPRERRSDGGNGHKITRRHVLQWLRNKIPQLYLYYYFRTSLHLQVMTFFYVFDCVFCFISIFMLVQSPLWTEGVC